MREQNELTDPLPWKCPRSWKGKECLIELGEDGNVASLWREPHLGSPSFTVFDPIFWRDFSVGNVFVHTDPRLSPQRRVGEVDPLENVRYMRAGVMSGLERDSTALPGRFIITNAIGLAVHLGASRLCLSGTAHVSQRAHRNLETMVRPLKGHRVYVFEPEGHTGLFPKE